MNQCQETIDALEIVRAAFFRMRAPLLETDPRPTLADHIDKQSGLSDQLIARIDTLLADAWRPWQSSSINPDKLAELLLSGVQQLRLAVSSDDICAIATLDGITKLVWVENLPYESSDITLALNIFRAIAEASGLALSRTTI